MKSYAAFITGYFDSHWLSPGKKTPGNARRQPTENLQQATIGESSVRLLCPQTQVFADLLCFTDNLCGQYFD